MKKHFTLSDFVPYLLNRAGVKIGLAFARDIESMGVTLPMWRVMVALWECGDQRLGELSERTSIDLSTLSRLLVTLQRKRFVSRGRSGTDGRALNICLTAKGRSVTERIIPIASHYEEVATRGISKRDLRLLKKMLVKLFSNIYVLDEEFVARHATPSRKARQRR